MDDATKVFFIILVSIIGMGYVWTGKKRRTYPFLLSGIIMTVYPYFVSNTMLVVGIALVLIIGPFFMRR